MAHEINTSDKQYTQLLNEIHATFESGKNNAIQTVNHALVQTYWTIGRYIVEYEQRGDEKAKYGDELLLRLSKDLTAMIGKGFSKSNIFNMRLFYYRFPIFQTVSGILSWSHYLEIISIDDELERKFYLAETMNNHWSVRELRRQKKSGLFMRLALSTDKPDILALSEKGVEIAKPEDIVKNTYVLEFLGLPEKKKYSENDLEMALIHHLEEFLLELGRGFAFIGRQYRITIDNRDYFADLVFYHVILKRYVVIELKKGEITPEDIGQLNLYLGYFAIDKNNDDDKEPIGILLGAEKNDIMVKFATHGMDSKLFVSKYQLYLPNVDELRKIVAEEMEKFDGEE
jgi:predicted nuclease of restriction endonuclease-like (RecB) superfamily